MPTRYDDRIRFIDAEEIMEVDFSNLTLDSSADVNRFYDRIEERIAATEETKWFFLVNYSHMRIDNSAWFAFSRRGKELNLAHSQGSVRFDTSEETRRQIERAAQTEAFDPNLFADRDGAIARIRQLPSQRLRKINHTPTFTRDDVVRRVKFWEDTVIMEVDFSNLALHHSGDVHLFYDYLEEAIKASDRKWFFLVNYENCEIYPEAWVSFAARGKALNIAASLGSVRFSPGSETEEDIRLRAESQNFRPNIRNSRDEALERIEELRAEILASIKARGK
ncbi:hypothetical protein [Actibacterium sp.]|uniref:hypothetical protein n=1 Tax=Actibacterium sp. TaxID=1872125 RepID=UPI00356A122B